MGIVVTLIFIGILIIYVLYYIGKKLFNLKKNIILDDKIWKIKKKILIIK